MGLSFVAIDFETANPKRVSACSLGYVKVVDGEIVTERNFLIKPVGEYSRMNIAIHGITPDKTENAPTFDVIFEELRPDFEALPVVCYSPFDSSVFAALQEYYNLNMSQGVRFVDVYRIASRTLVGLPNYKLPTVAYHLQIPYQTHHDAMCDAEQCAKIFLKLCGEEDVSESVMGKGEDWVSSFVGLVKEITADGVIELDEAYQLACFLDAISDKGKIFKDMAALVEDVLADGVVTATESRMVMALLDYALEEISGSNRCAACEQGVKDLASQECRRHIPDYAVKSHNASKAVISCPVVVPEGFEPRLREIPKNYKDHWAFVAANPFTTLASANIVITEDGVRISRNDAEELVRRLGGVLKSSVSRLTDFCVILGMPPESCHTGKTEAARKLKSEGSSIQIIGEDDFLDLAEATISTSR